MIEVVINTSCMQIARMQMECVQTYSDGKFGDYSIQIALFDGANGITMLQRTVEGFPRKRYNVLGLIQLALDTLTETELYLADEADIDHARRASDLGRRLERALKAL